MNFIFPVELCKEHLAIHIWGMSNIGYHWYFFCIIIYTAAFAFTDTGAVHLVSPSPVSMDVCLSRWALLTPFFFMYLSKFIISKTWFKSGAQFSFCIHRGNSYCWNNFPLSLSITKTSAPWKVILHRVILQTIWKGYRRAFNHS